MFKEKKTTFCAGIAIENKTNVFDIKEVIFIRNFEQFVN